MRRTSSPGSNACLLPATPRHRTPPLLEPLSELPRDVIEARTKVVNDVADDYSQAHRSRTVNFQAPDVESLVRLHVSDGAIRVGPQKGSGLEIKCAYVLTRPSEFGFRSLQRGLHPSVFGEFSESERGKPIASLSNSAIRLVAGVGVEPTIFRLRGYYLSRRPPTSSNDSGHLSLFWKRRLWSLLGVVGPGSRPRHGQNHN